MRALRTHTSLSRDVTSSTKGEEPAWFSEIQMNRVRLGSRKITSPVARPSEPESETMGRVSRFRDSVCVWPPSTPGVQVHRNRSVALGCDVQLLGELCKDRRSEWQGSADVDGVRYQLGAVHDLGDLVQLKHHLLKAQLDFVERAQKARSFTSH